MHPLPVEAPEEVDPVRQDDRLREANLGSAERLADAIGFTDHIWVDQGYREAARMTKGEECMMQIREAGHNGTAVPATTDHQDANGALQQLGIRSVFHRCAASSFLRYSCNGSVSISADRGRVFLPARLIQRAAVPPLRLISRPAPPGWVNSLWKKACCQAATEPTVSDFGVRMVPAQTAPLLSMFQ